MIEACAGSVHELDDTAWSNATPSAATRSRNGVVASSGANGAT
ncbi:MAG: hypothetical protein R3F34_15985 [Planctomycetota bacterium]